MQLMRTHTAEMDYHSLESLEHDTVASLTVTAGQDTAGFCHAMLLCKTWLPLSDANSFPLRPHQS